MSRGVMRPVDWLGNNKINIKVMMIERVDKSERVIRY